jgi:hypothetical protein
MRMHGNAEAAGGGLAPSPVVRDITQDGKTVRVIAESAGARGWVLRVLGRRGQVSEWTESFDSAAEAITTALTAIRYEGIEDFYEDPVFQYLENSSKH